MEKNTGKKVVSQGKHREFYLGWNVATLNILDRTWLRMVYRGGLHSIHCLFT